MSRAHTTISAISRDPDKLLLGPPPGIPGVEVFLLNKTKSKVFRKEKLDVRLMKRG